MSTEEEEMLLISIKKGFIHIRDLPKENRSKKVCVHALNYHMDALEYVDELFEYKQLFNVEREVPFDNTYHKYLDSENKEKTGWFAKECISCCKELDCGVFCKEDHFICLDCASKPNKNYYTGAIKANGEKQISYCHHCKTNKINFDTLFKKSRN